jgi:hypothetical protein
MVTRALAAALLLLAATAASADEPSGTAGPAVATDAGNPPAADPETTAPAESTGTDPETTARIDPPEAGADPAPSEPAPDREPFDAFRYLREMPERPAAAAGSPGAGPDLDLDVPFPTDRAYAALVGGAVGFGLGYVGELAMWGMLLEGPDGMAPRWGLHWLPVAGPVIGLVDVLGSSCGGDTQCETTLGLVAAFDVILLVAQSACLAALIWGISNAPGESPTASGAALGQASYAVW